MPPILEFEGVSKEYRSPFNTRRVAALRDFSLRVEPGEILGFLGPNGAGKTTAIHIAMGFLRPSSGQGQMLGHTFGNAAARRRVGYLAENVALYNRPAERLVRFYGALNGVATECLKKRTREVLRELGLFQESSRNTREFSRGMLQRLGLAQALVNDPELLILDEPTAALDPIGRVQVRAILMQARDAGKSVILSSHLLSEVELISDRVAVLVKGRLVRLGRTPELLEAKGKLQVVCRNVNIDGFPGAVVSDGKVTFSIPINEQRKVLERVWSVGGEIISVNPLRGSLEEVFLEAAAETDQDDAR